jgi:basic membrane protein A
MKTKQFIFAVIALSFIILYSACSKKEEAERLKIGLVSGIGSLDDKGFNQMAVDGLQVASLASQMDYEVKGCSSFEDIVQNIDYFVSNDFDLIITLGFDAAQTTFDAATNNPGIHFLLLDYSFTSLPENMACVTFQIDEVSFPAGFLAAYWTYVKNPTSPKVGYVAGPEIPPIQQFTESFRAGVTHFNSRYNLNVAVSGVNASNFVDTLQGAHLADSLMLAGAEVIFACAGKTGNGALYKVKEAGKTAIGVDTDQYFTIPLVGDILLTSCIKRMDEAVMSEVISFQQQDFQSAKTIVYNLKNKGVALADFHDFDPMINDSIKIELLNLKQDIINGLIDTGWQ